MTLILDRDASYVAPVVADPLILVLAGQSNMLRAGAEATYADSPYDASIVVESMRWYIEDGASPGTVETPGGPGLSIARGIVAATGRNVGVVGAALSGSNVEAWTKGHDLYDDMLAAIQATGYPVAGFFFAQGEVDARDDGYVPGDVPGTEGTALSARGWGVYCRRLIASLREDLDQPDLPVVLGRLAHNADAVYGHWDTIQAQQDDVAARVANVAIVDPEPVVLVDTVHWTQASYDLVAATYVTAWLELTA